ncbi:hypothetical protein F4780DRAFT_779890 [Xylariomycetidae sp. FL0641]|nr:hypothetical protein F4780DRAFT_779890 [Xylariomycetidae sp. FL0641]
MERYRIYDDMRLLEATQELDRARRSGAPSPEPCPHPTFREENPAIPGKLHGRLPLVEITREFPYMTSIIWSKGPLAATRRIADVETPVPPLIPVPASSSDWDPTVLVHSSHRCWTGFSERRHNGWETVEQQWTAPQPPAATQKSVPARSIESEVTSGDQEEPEASQTPIPSISIPTPNLEPDFRMRIKLSAQWASVAVGDSFKKWTTVADGAWSGQLGQGTVVNGGQETQDLDYGQSRATQVEAMHRLKTNDASPAYIECKIRGFRTGPPGLMEALQDPDRWNSVDPRQYRYRVVISMKTTDARYAEKVNIGLWVGSCLWKGREIVYE